MGVPGGSVVKNLPANVGSIPVGKVSWRRKCQHTPIFLPGKSQRTEEPGGLVYGVVKSWTQLGMA